MNTLRTQNLRRQRSLPVLLLLLGLLTVLIGPEASSQDTEPTAEEGIEPAAESEAEVIATVGTTRLTRADLEQAVRRRSGGRPIPAEQQDRLQAQAVGDLVEKALLQAEIERRQVEVTDGEINDRIAQLSTELTARQSSLDAFLAGAGLDHEGLREQVRFEIAVPKVILPMITEDVMRQVLAMHRETTALLRAAFAESLFAKGPAIVTPPAAAARVTTSPETGFMRSNVCPDWAATLWPAINRAVSFTGESPVDEDRQD